MANLMTEDRALKLLRQAVKGAGGQRRYAETRGISQAILSTSLTGARPLSPKVLGTMGLEKVAAYQFVFPERSSANPNPRRQ